ncbi:MAG TPA: hypothetical protein VF316_08585 [Polyangiaceae bacterium]
MGVEGVSGSSYKASDSELESLRGNEGIETRQILARVAKDAHYGERDILVRGDDQTYREKVADFKSAGGSRAEIIEAHAHLVEVGVDVVGEAALEHAGLSALAGASGAAFAIAMPAIGLGVASYKILEANARGRELNDALAKDEVHLALLTHLPNLPGGFRDEELAKYPDAGKGNQSGTQKMSTWMSGADRALMPIIELHCDQGMNAAVDACEGGVSRDAALKNDPAVAKRYAEDPAFKAGFDGMFWAKEHGAPGAYEATRTALANRDKDYVAHGVQCRV